MRQVQNKMKAVLKKEILDKILLTKGWTYENLLNELKSKYGIDIAYTTFARLMINKSTWQLTYAFIICDFFDLGMKDLFILESTDPID